MNLKRSFIHSLIAIPVLLIGFNTAFQVPARSFHLLHAHPHCSGPSAFHGCVARSPRLLTTDGACLTCDAFDLFHTVFFSKPIYFPGYFTGTAGPVLFHVPAFIQDVYLFCSARAPPA